MSTSADTICHRIAEDGGIEPVYPEEKVRLLVTEAARLTLVHFVHVCTTTAHDDSVSKLLELFPMLDNEQTKLVNRSL